MADDMKRAANTAEPKLHLATDEEIAAMNSTEDAIPIPEPTGDGRCPHCGRFRGLVNGVRRCSQEIDVYPRAWTWEHL
jgi:hypothetical protein